MLDSLEDYEWKETSRETAEKAYFNMDKDVIYIEDTFKNQQTEIDDYLDEDRYQVKLSRGYNTPDHPDKTLHTTMNWNEAEAFLEAKTGDLQ